jgi:hypothetical protein
MILLIALAIVSAWFLIAGAVIFGYRVWLRMRRG